MGYPINIPKKLGCSHWRFIWCMGQQQRDATYPKRQKIDLQQNAVQLYAKARNRPWRREVEPCLKTWAKRIGVTEPTLVKSGEFTWANTDHWGWLTTVFITFCWESPFYNQQCAAPSYSVTSIIFYPIHWTSSSPQNSTWPRPNTFFLPSLRKSITIIQSRQCGKSSAKSFTVCGALWLREEKLVALHQDVGWAKRLRGKDMGIHQTCWNHLSNCKCHQERVSCVGDITSFIVISGKPTDWQPCKE